MTKFGLNLQCKSPECFDAEHCPALKNLEGIPDIQKDSLPDGSMQISCIPRFYQLVQQRINTACANCKEYQN